jgi:large subunit ribosomal protein L3
MTQIYSAAGVLVPVTVIEAGPCTVVATRRAEREGYVAAQLGFRPVAAKRLGKPMQGQFKKAGTDALAVLREFPLADGEVPTVGARIGVGDVFQPGDRVAVTGVSKGRGTAGVIKRHHFSGFPGSHGTHEYFRHGGSIGNRSFPGRVFKGKRMAGRLGNERVTTTNLQIVEVRAEEHLLLVRGAIPGARGGTVLVHRQGARR